MVMIVMFRVVLGLWVLCSCRSWCSVVSVSRYFGSRKVFGRVRLSLLRLFIFGCIVGLMVKSR